MTKTKEKQSKTKKKKNNVCKQCSAKCKKIHGNGNTSTQSDSSDTLSFFKIMLDDFTNTLYLPPKCSSTLKCLLNKHVLVQDSYGLSWRVKVSEVNGSLAFVEGWRNFVLDHAIKLGEFVVFKLISKATLSAHIFATSACERQYYCAKNQRINQKEKKKKRKSSIENLATSSLSQTIREETPEEKVITYVGGDAQGSNTYNSRSSDHNKLHHKHAINPQKKESNYPVNRRSTLVAKHTEASCHLSGEIDKHAKKVGKNMIVSSLNEENSIRRAETTVQKVTKVEGINSEVKQNLGTCSNPVEVLDDTELEMEVEVNPTSDTANPLKLQDKSGFLDVVNDDKCDNLKYPKAQDIPCPMDCTPVLVDLACPSKEVSIKEQKYSIDNNPKDNYRKEHLRALCVDTCSNRKRRKQTFQDDKDAKFFADVGSATRRVVKKEHEIIDVQSGMLTVDASTKADQKKKTCSEENLLKIKSEIVEPAENKPNCSIFSVSTSVESHSWLVLPLQLPLRFRKIHRGRKVVVIQDVSMRLWPVLYHDSVKFVGFTAGWEDLTKANNVQEGDKCEVHLLNVAEAILRVTFSRS